MRFNILSDKRFLVLVALSFLMVSTALMVPLGHADTAALVPDWTSVTHDFFNLSPATTEPVLTASMVNDRANVTFVADPFLFNEGSTWYMFFEVNQNGNVTDSDIGLATSSDGLHWTYQQIVLDESFHVAHPYVFKWDGTYYMIPDTYDQNTVKLYQATNFPNTWIFVANIVSGPGYVDSAIFRYNDMWWLFTSDYPNNMYLYYSDNLANPSSWHSHLMNPIISGDPSKARGVGSVVFNGNTIIRLAQKDDVVYGQAVRAFQVDTLTTTSYAEHEISQSPLIQASGSGWNKDGMHTLDPWWIGTRWLVAVDGVNYSPTEVWSIGIYQSPVAKYQLTMSTNYGEVSPGNGTQDIGSTVTITATSPINSSVQRYVFTGWIGTGAGSYSGSNNPASVTMNGNITETASWKIQYYLNVTSAQESSSPSSGWFDSGSSINAFVASPFPNGTDTRYLCTGWTGIGSVPASGTASAVTFTITAPSNITWNWKAQYYLTVTSAHGTVGGAGWYDSGASAYATVTPLTVAGTTGTQYAFTVWSGDASGTTSPSNAITMNGPKTATAIWTTQYYLTVTSAYGTVGGAGWYDSGASAYATVTPLTVAGTTGTQYAFTVWSGDASGTTSPSNAITMNGPKTATANWITQYLVTFGQSGVASDFTGTVMIVNGTSYDRTGFTTWANASDVYTFSYVASPLVVTPNGKQCLLTGVSGNSTASSLTASEAATITGAYKTQYYLTMTSAYDSPSPSNGWFDSGSSITGSVASPVSGDSGTQYVCTGWSGTGSVPASGSASAVTFTISAPSNITWNWKTQYLVSFAVSPSGEATTSPSGTNLWEDPGTYSISATPNYGYTFSSWSTDTGNITFAFPTLSSTTATISGPGTITANLATAPTPTPTPTPTHTPTPSASPSPSPSPTLSPTQSPTTSPSQSPSAVNNNGIYAVYGVVVALILAGAIAAVIAIRAIRKRNKTSTFQ